MKKFFSNLLIIIYAAIAIFVTVCLLSFNEHRVTVFGNYSLVIIDSDEIKGDFNKGSLVIVSSDPKPEVGQKAFFYDSMGQNQIVLAEVTARSDFRNTDSTYTFGGDTMITGDSVIGATENAKEIPYAGTILRVLESKWGYLFLVVLISLLMFLYEITKAVEDIKAGKEEAKEEKEEDKKETPQAAPVVENKPEEIKENKLEEKIIDEPAKEEKVEESIPEETVTKDVEEIKEEVTEVAEEVKDETVEAAEEIKEEAKEVAEEVKEEVTEAAEETKEEIEEAAEEADINTEDIEKALDEIEDEEVIEENNNNAEDTKESNNEEDKKE